MSKWSLVFYQTVNGRCPVQEYIDDLDAKEAARIKYDLDLLEEYGFDLGAPHVKSIRGKLWELRTPGSKQLDLLHAFTKKTPKTPLKETEIATKRMVEYKERMGK